jgi:hypothetical protein
MKQLHGRIADVREWPDWVGEGSSSSGCLISAFATWPFASCIKAPFRGLWWAA